MPLETGVRAANERSWGRAAHGGQSGHRKASRWRSPSSSWPSSLSRSCCFAATAAIRVTAEFVNAGQLVKGNEVKAGGVSVGSVKSIDVTQDGHAEVELGISTSDYEPLRRGTQVMIKQASLSGIANRYVDLKLGPANGEEIDDGGTIGPDQTGTAVELDQIFDLFDERTRTGPPGLLQGLRRRCCAGAARSCARASTT